MREIGLVGATGFVGSTLHRQRHFLPALVYNSKNIEDIVGKRFDLVICAGAPGEKWRANQHPEDDWRSIARLISCLKKAFIKKLVIISTIDVYDYPIDVNENDVPKILCQSSYGKHRYILEQSFPTATVIRLPALFGKGLKKNALFDLCTYHMTSYIPVNAEFQWYPMACLSDDIENILKEDISLINLVSNPVKIKDIRDRFFPKALLGPESSAAPKYKVDTVHFAFKICDEMITEEMEEFVKNWE